MTKRWQCTVCGYIHEGNEPPEFCPICGADKTKFIPLDTEDNSLFHEMISVFKFHPVLAHFPGGLMPTSALFLLLYLITKQPDFEKAAFWLIPVLTIVVPLSIGTGIHDWTKYFGKKRAPVFYKKLGLALTLLTLGLIATVLRYDHASLLMTDSWHRWLYLLCLSGMLISVSFLGHYGSILAAQAVRSQKETENKKVLLGDRLDNSWLQGIFTQAPDAILAADTTGIIRLWNHGAERIFGVRASEAIGQSLNLIIPENLRQQHWAGWAEVMQSGKSRYGEDEMLRVPAIRGDGTRFSAEFSIVMLKDKADKISGIAAILRDVSEQWNREKKLKAQLETCLSKKLESCDGKKAP